MSEFESHPLYPGEGIPLFIAAGILKEPAQLEPFYGIEDSLVVPVLTLGSFTISEWAGNAAYGGENFVYYDELGMAGNALGLPNPGEQGIVALKDPIKRLADLGIKTIISVTNLPQEKLLDVIPRLVETAAECQPTAIEVNLSCPNGKKPDGTFHSPTCNDDEASGEVMEAARHAVGDEICLGAKDSPHVTSLEDEMDELVIERLAVAIVPYIDFLTGINTIGNQPFPEITCAGGRGGMSGPIVAPVAKQWLKYWTKHVPDLAKLSCGGVDSINAQIEIPERLEIGAMLVGGNQEFYRASQLKSLTNRWVQEYVASY